MLKESQIPKLTLSEDTDAIFFYHNKNHQREKSKHFRWLEFGLNIKASCRTSQ
jgi:hypothetical protein